MLQYGRDAYSYMWPRDGALTALDAALGVAARAVVRRDGEQAGQLALRPGVRLQRDGGVAGQRAQHLFQLRDHFAVAHGLRIRRERVDVGELGPRDREHLGRRVELHRAGAERDHRMGERDVLRLQAAQVADRKSVV